MQAMQTGMGPIQSLMGMFTGASAPAGAAEAASLVGAPLGGAGGALSILSIAPMAMIVAIMLLEFLVAGLQAYVFAILTCIYLNEALHLHDQH